MKKILVTSLLILSIASTAFAINTTVPQSTGLGSLLYGLANGLYTTLNIGAEGSCLGVSGGVPAFITCATGSGGVGTSTNPFMATYIVATSTTATSTLPNLKTTTIEVGGDYINDFTGSGLKVVNGALTASSTAIYINVKDYGAVGDGTTDDTATIDRAISVQQNQNTSSCLFFPVGVYEYTGTISPAWRMCMIGVSGAENFLMSTSSRVSKIEFNNSNTQGFRLNATSAANSTGRTDGHRFENMEFAYKNYQPGANTSARMFDIGAAGKSHRFYNLSIRNSHIPFYSAGTESWQHDLKNITVSSFSGSCFYNAASQTTVTIDQFYCRNLWTSASDSADIPTATITSMTKTGSVITANVNAVPYEFKLGRFAYMQDTGASFGTATPYEIIATTTTTIDLQATSSDALPADDTGRLTIDARPIVGPAFVFAGVTKVSGLDVEHVISSSSQIVYSTYGSTNISDSHFEQIYFNNSTARLLATTDSILKVGSVSYFNSSCGQGQTCMIGYNNNARSTLEVGPITLKDINSTFATSFIPGNRGTLASDPIFGQVTVLTPGRGGSNSTFSSMGDGVQYVTTRMSTTTRQNGYGVFNANVGIGTTTPYAPLSVVGQAVAEYFTATSTTATSTITNDLKIGADSRNNMLSITPARNYSSSISTGGALNITNSSNTGVGLEVYSTQSTPAGRLVVFNSDSASFDQDTLRVISKGNNNAIAISHTGTGNNSIGLNISSSGNGDAASFNQTGTSSSASALQLTSSNMAESALSISGVETGRGTIKVTHIGNSTSDGNSAGLSIDLTATTTPTASQGIFITSTTGGTIGKLLNIRNNLLAFGGADSQTELMTLTGDGKLGLSTSSPYARLSVVGEVVATNYTATGTATSTFRGVRADCFSTDGTNCITGTGGSGSSFAYPFPSNATTTEITFSGGLIASNATTTNATSTNFFATTASTTNLFVGSGLAVGTSTTANGLISVGLSAGTPILYLTRTGTAGYAKHSFASSLYNIETSSGLLNITSSLNDSTNKSMILTTDLYNTANGRMCNLIGSATLGVNSIGLGGGSSSCKAATGIVLYTSADANTTTGTAQMTMTNYGATTFGGVNPGAKLEVIGNATTSRPIFRAASSTNATELVVDYNGNVGIGTTTPYAKLSVNGQIVGAYVTSTTTATSTFAGGITSPCFSTDGTNCITSGGGSGASDSKWSTSTDTTSIYPTSATKLGIGTTSPYAKLSVVGEAVAEKFTATSTTATSTFNGGLLVDSGTLTVDYSTNRVGINTLTPTNDLQVNGSIRTTNMRLDSGGAIVNNSSQNNNRIVSDTTGLTFDRNVADSNPLAIFTQLNSGSTGDIMQWKNNVGTLGVFSQTGQLGIGTTSPYAKLSVVGDIVATAITATSTFNTSGTSGGYKIDGNLILQASSTNLSTLVGKSAGAALLSDGLYNTALGFEALKVATSSDYNTAVGYRSLYLNTTGGSNTASGYSSLYSNTTGNYNSANGYQALYSNTTGSGNTATGYASLYYNTIATNNTANGHGTLFSNTTGLNNTASGYASMYSNTTGTNNNASGGNTLYFNTTGQNNNASGYAALYANTTGVANSAVGYASLYNNTTGNYNTANGSDSLRANVTGSYNTANGYLSLRYGSTTSGVTSIGYLSGVGATNALSDYNSLSDTYMTFLGTSASRDNNVASTTALTNSTAIGYNAKVGGSNMMVLGNGVKVGIGTSTPIAYLDVLSTQGGSTPLFSIASSTSGAGTSTALYVSSNGFVGIGTTTPWTKFGVSGTVAMSGLTTAAGTPNSVCINASTKEITENAALTCTVSDEDQKTPLKPLTISGLDTVMKLQPSSFSYLDNTDRTRYGFGAQSVQKIDNRLGDAFDKDGVARSIDLPALIAVNTKAIQELNEKVEATSPSSKEDTSHTLLWIAIGALGLGLGVSQYQIYKLKR